MTELGIRIYCDGKYTMAKKNWQGRWTCTHCHKPLDWLVGSQLSAAEGHSNIKKEK